MSPGRQTEIACVFFLNMLVNLRVSKLQMEHHGVTVEIPVAEQKVHHINLDEIHTN